ncbi:hypothetical protein PCANC_21676 [Puccinia coronata f. sp. avenae]|uniref:Uncharacterized protein n=1 Tax=Puccinia coronata f. sp. avenae TaxID=200324 RepID=A0A2N5UJB0_9BASI|nr:hypothetical protein PCANC_21676 [Puccinia coronata f. sp. avenae]
MSLKSFRGFSDKPSQRLHSAARLLKHKVNAIKDRLKLDEILHGESQPEGILHISPPIMFEFEIMSGYWQARLRADSHHASENSSCHLRYSGPAENRYNPRRETRETDSFHIHHISPPLPQSQPSPLFPQEPFDLRPAPVAPRGSPERELRRRGLAAEHVSQDNPLGLPLRFWCPSPSDQTDLPSLPHLSAYQSSETSSLPQREFTRYNRASKVSIRVSVSFVRSSLGPAAPPSSLEEEFDAKDFSSRPETLDVNSPGDFIHHRNCAGNSHSKKRVSSFGVARVLISTPADSKGSQLLSPSFKTWLGEYIETRLNSEESKEGLVDDFDFVVTKEGGDSDDSRAVHPIEEFSIRAQDFPSASLGIPTDPLDIPLDLLTIPLDPLDILSVS